MLHKNTITESKYKFKKKEVVDKSAFGTLVIDSSNVVDSSDTSKNPCFILESSGANSSVISNWSIIPQEKDLPITEAVAHILKSMDRYQEKWEKYFEQEAKNEEDLFDLDNENA